jgi:hypothetical protein
LRYERRTCETDPFITGAESPFRRCFPADPDLRRPPTQLQGYPYPEWGRPFWSGARASFPPAWGAPRAGLGRIDARSRPWVPRRRSPSSGLRPAPRPSGGAIGFAKSVGSRGAVIRNHSGDRSAWLSGKQNRITAAEEVLERSVTSPNVPFFLSLGPSLEKKKRRSPGVLERR